MTYERFEVVVVPFPFTDKAQVKRRPALVLSSQSFDNLAGHSVMAMITSAANPSWPYDVMISDLTAAGLPAPSVVRMKLFTLDHRLVAGRCGALSDADREEVESALREVLGD